MTEKNSLLEKIVPFLVVGIGVAVLLLILILMSYALLWGGIIGAVLWVGYVVKNKLMGKQPTVNKEDHKGVTIEHDDIK